MLKHTHRREPRDAQRAGSRRALPAKHRDAYVFFDNDAKVHAPFDAMEFADRLDVDWNTNMPNDRIAALQKMLLRSPDDPRLHFGLALEFEKLGLWTDAAVQFRRYLELTDDEGNAWGRLGHALRQLGQDDEARAAYSRGIEAARAHGHPSMAAEFEETLQDW